MNEKCKKIIIAIGSGIFALFSFICGVRLYNKGKSVERTRRDTKDIRRTEQSFEDASKRFGKILQEVRKTKHDDGN